MKRIALLSFCLLVVASFAFAQGGNVGLYADLGATSCNVADPGGFVATPVYAIHVTDGISNASLGSQFRIVIDPGVTMVLGGIDNNYPLVIGNPQSGAAIAYSVCAALPTLVFTLNFFSQGTSDPCSYIHIESDPTAPGVLTLTCNGAENIQPKAGQLIVNGDPSCDCDVATEPQTWGKIKSLYGAD